MAQKSINNKLVQVIDLDSFQNAVNGAAARVRGLWLGYIALLAYLLISVGAVTHRDLLLESSINLPVLQVKLPLIGFFVVAPIVFLLNHFFLLLQLFGLGQRLREFNDAISKTDLDEAERRQERRKLDTFTIVQMLAAPSRERKQVVGMLHRVIAVITLVIAPIMLLLIIQLQFLPYQNELITWVHRLVLSTDLILLWMLWPSINQGVWSPWCGKRLPMWQGWMHWRDYVISWRRCCVSWLQISAVIVVMFFAIMIATFPGEIADGGTNAQDWSGPVDSNFSWLKTRLFHDGVYSFSRVIDLVDDKTLIDLDIFDRINKRHLVNKDILEPWQAGRTLTLRQRNLRGARFDRVDLRNVDFYEANLQGASIDYANLQGALLDYAKLQDASLEGARLQGASLNNAWIQDASLDNASLQGASLSHARLQGASLYFANFQGASLDHANLRGALLDSASFQGASLYSAWLEGASLNKTRLQGAKLDNAKLQGATFNKAKLQGASFNYSKLQGALLRDAFLWRAYGKSINVEEVEVINPKLNALSPKELLSLSKLSIKGVTDERLKKRIKQRLARLYEQEKNLVEMLPDNYWNKLEGEVSDVDHQKKIVRLLEAQVCGNGMSSHFVAEGLIWYRSQHISSDSLPELAQRLFDSVEGRVFDCPSLMELDAETIDELASQAEG